MLSRPHVDFEGGVLEIESEFGWICPKFGFGDAVVFESERFHRITTLEKGIRHVLVLEIWEGPTASENWRPGEMVYEIET